MRALAFSLPKELLGLLVAPSGEQTGRVRGRGAKQRLGNCHLVFPLGIRQIKNRRGPFGFRHNLGIDDQHPRPGRESVPHALDRAIHSRDTRRHRRLIRFEQPQLLQAQRVEDLVVPKHVAARAIGLGDDRLGQAHGLGRLGVVLGQGRNAGVGCELSQNRLREFGIQRRVNHHFVVRTAPAAAGGQAMLATSTNRPMPHEICRSIMRWPPVNSPQFAVVIMTRRGNAGYSFPAARE